MKPHAACLTLVPAADRPARRQRVGDRRTPSTRSSRAPAKPHAVPNSTESAVTFSDEMQYWMDMSA